MISLRSRLLVWALVAGCWLFTLPARASDLVTQVASMYGVEERLLRAMMMTESRGHPWTLNIHGESFYLSSRAQAADLVRKVQTAPYLLKATQEGRKAVGRWFFASADEANAYGKALAGASFTVRRVNPRMIDMGLMQINLHYHGKRMPSLERALDPDWNISYGAYYLSTLIARHKSVAKAVGYYNAATPSKRVTYTRLVLANYERLGSAGPNRS